MNRKLVALLSFVGLMLLLGMPTMEAQQPVTGVPPLATVSGGPFDEVNLANLDVHFTIPIFSRPGKGMPFYFNLAYDGLVWSPTDSNGNPNWTPVSNWGWSDQTNAVTGAITYALAVYNWVNPDGIHCARWTYTSFRYLDTSGTAHTFSGNVTKIYPDTDDCGPDHETLSPPSRATDNSGLLLNFSVAGSLAATATTASGVVYDPINGRITDPNGNTITISNGNITDTLGTHPLTFSSGTNQVVYQYTAPSGGTAQVKVNYTSYKVMTNFGIAGVNEYGGNTGTSRYLVSSIVLPDSSQYSFTYEKTYQGFPFTVTGRLASVTLPTGGVISYSYSTQPGGSDNSIMSDGSPATLRRTIGSGTWTYTRSSRGGSLTSTTVIDPASNETDLKFSGIYMTQRATYNGNGTSKAQLQDAFVCYNGNYISCQTASVDATTGISSQAQYEDFPNYMYTLLWYDGYGNLTNEEDHDLTSGNPTLRKTNIAFNSSLCSSTYNICDRPASVQIADAGSNSKSYTTYAYDEGGNTHGSLTTVNRYINGTTTGPVLTSHFGYYGSNGVLGTATDVNNTVTTYSGSGYSCNGAFPNSVSVPGDGGTTISYSYQYNCSGGVVTQVTNNSSGHYGGAQYRNDPFYWRPDMTFDLAGVQTWYNYYGQSNQSTGLTLVPGQVESVLTNNANSTVDVLTTVDAFGRSSLTQQREAPGSSSWDTVETLYDPSGRVSWATLPFVESAGYIGNSVPGINYRYDGLGRYTDIDSSYWGGIDTHYSYYQNDVTVSTPFQSRQYEYDAVGDLISVCEISTAGAGCGQNAGGTGYETNYTYNTLGNLTGVTQSSNVSPSQSRSYSYDGLSRLTGESNPESGTVSYTYDSDSSCSASYPGDMVKKVDNAGNRSCFYYDGLHRPYQAGGSVCRRWVYDTASVNNVQMANAVGQLAEIKTDNCVGTQFTDEGFSYDPNGRATDVYESTPHSGGYYHAAASYYPNGAIMTLNSSLGGVPYITYGLDGEGRIFSVSANSGQNPVTATTYNYLNSTTNIYQVTPVSGVSYGSGDSDAFTYDNLNRMTQSSYNIGPLGSQQQITHTFGWNANGTLASLGIADPLNSLNQQNCTYNYDALGRVATLSQNAPAVNCRNGSQTVWKQDFRYDQFGNITKNGSIAWTPSYLQTNNQIDNQYVQAGGISYDANGNLLSDTFNTYTWDTWGELASANGNALVYDALGRMVENTTSAGTREYLYAPGGSQVLAQVNGQTSIRVQYPLPGGGLAQYNGGGTLTYARADWLGSSRLVSSSAQTMVNDSAYAPFGEQYAAKNIGSGFYDFTGQEQWTVSGSSAALDDFLFRKYHPVQGRWISPDPAGMAAVDITNPQTWNRYAYVGNNPLNFVDALGLIEVPCPPDDPPGTVCTDVDSDSDSGSGPPDPQVDGSSDCPGGMCPDPQYTFFVDVTSPGWLIGNFKLHAPSNGRTTCTGSAMFTGVGGKQAMANGALYSQYPAQAGGSIRGGTFGTVAVQNGFLGLSTRQLRTYGTQIFITPSNQGLFSQYGGPTGPLSVSDYGDANIQATSGVAFDVYRFPTVSAGMQFGRRTMSTTISFPNSSGASCPAGFTVVP